MNDKLLKLRENISLLDKKLLYILSKRRNLSLYVAKIKKFFKKPIIDKVRERDLLKFLIAEGKKLNLDHLYIMRLFRIIMDDSRNIQEKFLNLDYSLISIAFLGPKGSYSYLAAKKYSNRYFKHFLEYSCYSFSEICKLVETCKVKYGILPIENNCSGSIDEVYDLLTKTNLFIVGEVYHSIDHCILVKGNTDFQKVKTIYSHPEQFKQCSKFFNKFSHWTIHHCLSTSDAMKKVSKLNSPTIAALGSNKCYWLYGLQVLINNIANHQLNITRFIVVSKHLEIFYDLKPKKTTIVIVQNSTIISLAEIMNVFYSLSIQISHLEYRTHEEILYLDIFSVFNNNKMQIAITKLRELNISVKVLGSYSYEKPIYLNI